MSEDTLYVNQPGGIIVHMKSGESKSIGYGQPVPVDEVADYVSLSGLVDDQQRNVGAAEQQVKDAHERAALRENGQVQSGSSPVPSNYAELDEEAAARLVSNLARYPESQAQVLVHEIVYYGGRQQVLDSASNYARIAAQMQVDAEVEEARPANQPLQADSVIPHSDPGIRAGDAEQTDRYVSGLDKAAQKLGGKVPPPTTRNDSSTPDEGDDEDAALAARHGDPQANGDENAEKGLSYNEFNKKQLQNYVDQHGLPVNKNQSEAKLREDLQKVEGHEQPQTPPQ